MTKDESAPNLCSRRDLLKEIKKEIDSPFNRWVTGEAVKHDPIRFERLVHYHIYKGPRHLYERYKA